MSFVVSRFPLLLLLLSSRMENGFKFILNFDLSPLFCGNIPDSFCGCCNAGSVGGNNRILDIVFFGLPGTCVGDCDVEVVMALLWRIGVEIIGVASDKEAYGLVGVLALVTFVVVGVGCGCVGSVGMNVEVLCAVVGKVDAELDVDDPEFGFLFVFDGCICVWFGVANDSFDISLVNF